MIFIPFNCPSLKNSKIKTATGIFHSKTVGKYLRNLGIQSYSSSKKEVKEYKTKPNLFRKVFEDNNWIKPDKQMILGFHFVRGSKHSFDFNNATQIILDLLTAHDFIEDDSMDWIVPQAFNLESTTNYYSYDKNNAGVYIKILN